MNFHFELRPASKGNTPIPVCYSKMGMILETQFNVLVSMHETLTHLKHDNSRLVGPETFSEMEKQRSE